jgi:PST family polysaccharide transporter
MPQNKNPDSSESVLAVAEAAEAAEVAKEAKDADLYFRTDHLKADLGARTARGGIVVLASQALKFVINMGTTIILARLLTPQDYGLIGMVLVVTGFVSLFKNMGLSAATMQREEINYKQVSTLFWINVAVSVALMLLTVALAPVVALFYREPRLMWITMAFGVGFLFSGLVVQHEALLKRQMRFVPLAIAEIVSMVAGIVVGVVMAWRGAGYWALVANQLVLGFVYAVSIWIACRWRPGRPVRYSGVRSMLAFGGNLTGFSFFNYFSRTLDNLLIGRVWGAQQLGLYAKAYQLLLLPIDQLSSPLDGVALPALSRLSGEPERYRQAFLRILEKIAMVSMPFAALMIGTSDWLVRIVLGPQWSETARIFALLGIVGLFEPVSFPLGWLLISQGRGRDLLRWGMIDGALSIASILAGLPWGAVGVAASFAIVGLCVRKQLQIFFTGRSGPVRASDIYRTIAPSACAAAGVLAALFGFRRWMEMPGPLAGLVVSFIITVGVAALFFFILPGGRTALQDMKNVVFLLVRTRKATP